MIYGYIKTGADKFSLLLPFCCFIAIFSALSYWTKISNSVWQQENKELLNEVTISYAIQVEDKIKDLLSPHQSIQRYIKNHDDSLERAAIISSYVMANHPEINQISYSPQGITSFVFPESSQKNIVGRVIRPPSKIEKSIKVNRLFFSQPITSDNGDVFFTANNPVMIDNEFWGYVSYRINLTQAINTINTLQSRSTYHNSHRYQLSHINDFKKLTMIAQSDSPLGKKVFQAPVEVPENNWVLEVSYESDNVSSLSNYGAIFRFLLTSAICLIIYWALLEPRRLRRTLSRTTNELANKKILINIVLNNINEGVMTCDNSGKIKIVNRAAASFFGLKKNQNLDINSPELYPKDNLHFSQLDSPMHQVLYRQQESQKEISITTKSNIVTSLKTQSKILFDYQKKHIGAVLLVQNVTKLKQAKNSHYSRNVILSMLANDKPIDEIFNHIINDIESQFEGLQGAILLLDNQKKHIFDVVAPQLPAFYTDSLKGLEIGDRVMSCGSAIFHNKMIIVEDITVHPYWIDYKNLALQAKISACWSQPIHNANGELLGTFDIYSDKVNPASPTQVLSLKEAAILAALTIERHRDSKRLSTISLALQHSSNALLIINNKGIIEYVNPKLCSISGYTPRELLSQPLKTFVIHHNSDDLFKEVWQSLSTGKDWRGEIKNSKKNGDYYWAYDHISAIRDSNNKITNFVIIQEDITESRQSSEQTNYLKNHDALTGLINHIAFDKKIQQAIALVKNNLHEHALCFIDIDNFSDINKKHGELACDELLRQVSTLFREHLRQRDTLARLNNNQFSILMQDCSTAPAKRCCSELINLLEKHQFTWQDHHISLTASIGITLIDQAIIDNEGAMKQADMACYLSKLAGGNQITIYNGNHSTRVPLWGDARFAKEIRYALEQDKFKLYVQPIIPLANSDEKSGLEILLRLEQTNGHLAKPADFLSAAQRYNLAKELDLWVITKTFSWFNDHPEELEAIDFISINLTSSSFGDDTQLINIITLIEQYPNIAAKIIFDITEQTITANLSNAYHFIKALSPYQIRFSLDNYGCGYLSFAQIKNIPFTTINIDGRLINEITTNQISKVIVESICRLAQVMGAKTIAKSVETKEVIPLLMALAIDSTQGFYQAKPMSIDTLLVISNEEVNAES